MRLKIYIRIMAKSTKQSSKKSSSSFLLFDAMNYKLMILQCLRITAGFILMSGGAELSGETNTAETFDTSIYSFRRIVLAPIVVVIGFVVEVFAIFIQDSKIRIPNPFSLCLKPLKQYS